MASPHPMQHRHETGLAATKGRSRTLLVRILDNLIQVGGSALLLLFSSPVFLALSFLVWRADGAPVYYSGERMGRYKRPFRMFKFRSLVRDAESRIGGDIMSKKMANQMRLEHQYGRFLRDSRLDELPQLFNVFRRDMDFVGPRPIRRQVYEKHGRQVQNFDKRFRVRPGLLGPSQVFTAHAAPPRLRAMIDNRFVEQKKSALADVGFVAFVFYTLLKNLFIQVVRYSISFHCTARASGTAADRRRSRRVPQENAYTRICSQLAPNFKTFISHSEDEWEGPYRVLDVNSEALLIETDTPITAQKLDLKLEKNVSHRGHAPKKRVAYVTAHLKFRKPQNGDENTYLYVVDYEAISPLNHYKLHQYFLEENIA